MAEEQETTEPKSEAQLLAERVVDGPWPVTVTLRHPVEFGKNETVMELHFQKGRFEFLKGMPVDETPTTDQLMVLASRLCGKPLKVIESLDPDDVQEVLAHALGFIARCRGAGRKASQ